MFQSFTGNSRRPRQVNLSGRNTNPFAAAGSAFGGPQGAIQSAQQDRQQRQKQRQELSAAKTVQRVWRGHNARSKTREAWRQQWDATDATTADPVLRLNMLLLFFSPSNDADVRRLVGMVSQSPPSPTVSQTYPRLQKACLAALDTPGAAHVNELLPVLTFLATSIPQDTSLVSVDYYRALSKLDPDSYPQLRRALVAPLQSRLLSSYEGLALEYLTTAHEPALLDDLLHDLSMDLDPSLLTQAVSNVSSTTSLDPRRRLWLLGQYLYLMKGTLSVSEHIPVVALLLSSVAEDIVPDKSVLEMDNKSYDDLVLATKSGQVQLNKFLNDQLLRLVEQDIVRSLISRPSTSSSASVLDDTSGPEQLLASYALTLLRMFPRRADDIRMWLYLGPPGQAHVEGTVPAIAYFWKGVRATYIFDAISREPRAAVDFLKAPRSSVSSWQPPSQQDHTERRASEWRVILLFLELFTFVLKIMDDEEFLGASSGANTRMSNNALPVPDIRDLTVFLKHLGFSMYYNSQEISESFQQSHENLSPVNLSRHFGGTPNPSESKPDRKSQSASVTGTLGTTIDSLKGLVTGLLRSIYERDSRRSFLPKGHWLMTSRFDMSIFISAVVEEDERRQQLQRQVDDDGDNDDDAPEEEGASSQPRNRLLQYGMRTQRDMRQASRKRYLEAVAPRLEILQNMPFMIPFETRVQIFREFVRLDQMRRRNGFVDADLWRHSIMFGPRGDAHAELGRHHANIRRKHEFEDAFEQFYEIGAGLKEPIQITFMDEFGLQEAGIDGGGVTKEFLTSVTSEALDPSRGLFMETSQHLLYPNPTRVEELKEELRQTGFSENTPDFRTQVNNLLHQYEFLGRVVGKCLYEGILIDVGFAGFFLLKWALFGGVSAASRESGYRPTINDLRELDEELYQGLLKLKYYSGDVQDWSTYFVINDVIPMPDGSSKTVEQDLVLEGHKKIVTNENRLMFISRVAQWRLSIQAHSQTTAFLEGLASIIQTSWLNMFNQTELQTLIGGAASSISIADLRSNTQYGGVYVIGDDGQEHPSVKLFWQVMENLPDEDRKKVLKFVTSTPRAPLLGFGSLNPRFSIRDSGDDEARFPTTSTCVNLLKLPRYKTAATLREKLLYAVNSGAGFNLS